MSTNIALNKASRAPVVVFLASVAAGRFRDSGDQSETPYLVAPKQGIQSLQAAAPASRQFLFT